jgi:hypothetical protein
MVREDVVHGSTDCACKSFHRLLYVYVELAPCLGENVETACFRAGLRRSQCGMVMVRVTSQGEIIYVQAIDLIQAAHFEWMAILLLDEHLLLSMLPPEFQHGFL